MKALPKILLALTAVAALSVVYPASVQAVPTTYQYTGNHFTTVHGGYTTSMFVSGMVTLAGPLAPNMPLTDVTPTAFTFSDGLQTLTNLTPSVSSLFRFATGPTGAISAWRINVTEIGPPFPSIATVSAGGTVGDEGVLDPANFGSNRDAPGEWTTVAGVPDTGSTLSLMTLTLMALGVAARRFQRAAA
jgi:hypothetical protein